MEYSLKMNQNAFTVHFITNFSSVSPDLIDILAAPSADAAVSKPRMKRNTGARCLTADEYFEMLRKERKK